jgi:hypothetical protein
VQGLTFVEVLSIELAQEVDIPGSLDVEFAMTADVNEVVGVIA